ncbi:DNA segregation ATPase FtsK/SpoIIIE [Bellilinea caldifistulae]|nr:DNA translocase FtsK [Bellilinea caldifistulae]GAP10121.1 DNA segregation ATPase FtsK/SpoIIIE [Bellilinea caldifistulae]
MSSSRKKAGKSVQKTYSENQLRASSLLEGVGRVMVRLERYGRDITGVLLIALGLLTLMVLVGWTSGSFISPYGDWLRRWLGIASFPLAILTALIGVSLLRSNPAENRRFPLGRILALEGLIFTGMAFLALLGGVSVERAEAGLDGGVIGWGLAYLITQFLPLPWSSLVLVLLGIWFLSSATGFHRWVGRRIQAWIESLPVEQLPEPPLRPTDRSQSNPDIPREEGVPVPVVAYRREENLPPLSLLANEESNGLDEERILAIARQIEKTLAEFGVPSRVVGYRKGPTVTQFAVEPGYVEKPAADGKMIRQKVRVAQISALSRDLALALAAERLRIEAPVPGHSYVGVEVPNSSTTLVRLRPILESPEFLKLQSPLAIALGRDVSGQPVVADLARMPHLLVAGTTGSGKSVCLASIITCLVMNNSPATLRLVVLDPKMVELARFSGLPHLLGKVETEIERMLAVLRWTLVEMEQRYRLFEASAARDLTAYNRKAERRGMMPLPRIVVLIDELADLMMSAPDQTEHSLVRLAQMARATGIHLVIATQRPSTDVVTGLIKANFPARVAFSVASSIDSRVILDVNGAESLLGRGDMLFLNPEAGTPLRAQGVLLQDQEIERVIAFWQERLTDQVEQTAPWEDLVNQDDDGDDLIEKAIELVRRTQRASASLLQRRLRIGFPRAARLLDELEERGIVGPAQGGGKDREVLIDPLDDDPAEDDD